MSYQHPPYTIEKGRDGTLEFRVLSHETAQLSQDAATDDTALIVRPLPWALSSGDKLLFGENTVVTLSGAAAAGVVSVPVNALAGPLRSSDVGTKIRDLTGFTVSWEMLERAGDVTPVIANIDVTVTVLTQTADNRGLVQVAYLAAVTTGLSAKQYTDALWRTNSGTKRPLSYGDVKIIEAGFLS